MSKQTIARGFSLTGVGAHTGKTTTLRVFPLEEGKIKFRRVDLNGAEISLDCVRLEAQNCSMLKAEQGEVQTVEHLMAAFLMLQVDSALVEMDGPEVPILDGSAIPFVQHLQAAGFRKLSTDRTIRRIAKPFSLTAGDACIKVAPDPDFRVTYAIEYDHPLIGAQGVSFNLDTQLFLKEVAPARTFGFYKDWEALKEKGLALGASMENTLVLDDKGVINGPLRFPDEFVRHKVLDFIGDVALLGYPLRGFFSVERGGHKLHHELVRHLKSHPELLPRSVESTGSMRNPVLLESVTAA